MSTHPSESPETPGETAPRKALAAVFLVVFIDLLGFGIVLPLLPRFADDAMPAGVPANVTGILIGVLVSSFSAMQFFLSPYWGGLSDRIGRRPVLLIGLGGSTFSYLLFGVASELKAADHGWLVLGLLLISRVGAGIFAATIPAAQAVIADCTKPEKRAHGMALIGMAFGMGFTFGPLIAYGAVLWFPDQPGAVGYVAAGFSFIALMVATRILKETRRPGVEAPVRSFRQLGRLASALRTPGVGVLILAFFLATLGFANLEGTLSLLTAAFNYSYKSTFLIFAFVGFMLMIAQGGVYRPMSKRVGEVTFMWLGLALMFVGLASLAGVAASYERATWGGWLEAWFYASLAVGVFGYAFLTPSVQSLISRRSDPEQQGGILGVNQSFSALARILGPLLGLTLFPLTESHLLPYLVGAILLVVLFGLMPRVSRV